MKDDARIKTDKILNDIKKQIASLYAHDTALLKLQREYADFFNNGELATLLQRYNDGELSKEEYIDAAKKATIQSRKYKTLVKKITRALAKVNQSALNVVNDELVDIYMINYNQIADKCKKMGITVNGD